MPTDTSFTQSFSENARILAEEDLISRVNEMLAGLLQEKKMSQTEIARLLRRHTSGISRLFNGHNAMTLRTLAALAYAFGGQVEISFVQKGNSHE